MIRKQTDFVGVRVPKQQREQLDAMAAEAGLTLSQFIRLVLREVVSVSKPTIIFDKSETNNE